MMQAQSDGTKVYGVTLVKPISIQLVPWNKHEVVLCSQQERYNIIDVFGNRLHQALGAEWNHYKTLGSINPTMIVLRPVVLAKPVKHRGSAQQTQLAFFVKLFGAPTEVGYMCGLKLGVLFAADMKTTQCTLAPYEEQRNVCVCRHVEPTLYWQSLDRLPALGHSTQQPLSARRQYMGFLRSSQPRQSRPTDLGLPRSAPAACTRSAPAAEPSSSQPRPTTLCSWIGDATTTVTSLDWPSVPKQTTCLESASSMTA